MPHPEAYEEDLVELPDWRIGWIFNSARDRGKGLAAAAVAAALEEISWPAAG